MELRLPDDLVLKGIELKDQYFDLKGLSIYSSLSISTLRHHIHSDGLPAFQLKGKILVRRSDFDLWMSRFRMTGQNLKKVVDEMVQQIGLHSRESKRQTH